MARALRSSSAPPAPAGPAAWVEPPAPGVARWSALAQALRAQVLAGHWPPGSALPSEQALAARHGVALGTMRQALQQLVTEGVVERIHGRGTFVRAGLAGASMLRFFRFGRTMGASAAPAAGAADDGGPGKGGQGDVGPGHGDPGKGGAGEVPASRIARRQVGPAPADAAAALGLSPRAPALKLIRLRSLHGQPCLWEQITLPLPRFAALAEGDTTAWDDLLYPFYARVCGVHVHRAVESIGFGHGTAAQARALGLTAGHPVARVHRVACDLAGEPVEHRITVGDAFAFHYAVTIT